MNIQGSTALVTGANRGLGQHLAAELVRRGARKVYATARDPRQLTAEGVVPLQLDITDEESVLAAARAAPDVSVLVNNAGISSLTPLLAGPMEEITRLMDTHFYGTLAVTRAFAPQLVDNAPAAILNIASVLSWLHPAELGAYSAAKAALWAQTDAIRAELQGSNVTVTALHVGYIDTDMAADVDEAKTNPALVARLAIDGVESGDIEVLADAFTRRIKGALSQDRGSFRDGAS